MLSTWEFKQQRAGYVLRESFEDEFFTGEEEDESTFGRTDALVRESIQNSLDARTGKQPARVRFHLSSTSEHLPQSQSQEYIQGLHPHLEAVGLELPPGPMSFLVVEDFETSGLIGDPELRNEPEAGTANEHWYWFWWRVGKSSKGGRDRGRWGLGRSVFAATSSIRTFFALTVRSNDRRSLLMGQAKLGGHRADDTSYVAEGFFHKGLSDDELPLPIEDAAALETFREQFHLARGQLPGLSLVVPFPFPTVKASEIARSVIVHYFLPILRGDLVVEVSGPDLDAPVRLDSDTIEGVSESMPWSSSRRDRRKPPFELARWAIQRRAEGMNHVLPPFGENKLPEWSDLQLPQETLAALRKAFMDGDRLAIRVPLTIELKSGSFIPSFFDVFVARDDKLERAEDFYVRGGMTISKISTLSGMRGTRGIVIVEDDVISKLLGDAEGPAHTEWSTGESRPDRDYVRWKRRVTFVRNSLAKVVGLLSEPPEELDESLLSDIFSVQDIRSKGKARKRRRMRIPDPAPAPEPSPPPQPERVFAIVQSEGGFRIRGNPGPDSRVERLRVRVAYDLPTGNPLKAWSPFDFVFDDSKTNPVQFSLAGARIETREANQFVVVVEDAGFDVEVRGFDTLRGDLVVKADQLEGVDDDGDHA